MSEPVLASVDRGVARIELNAPEQGNALGAELAEGLREAVSGIAARSDLRAVLLTGRGRSFCVGGDINGFRSDLSALSDSLGRSLSQLNATISQLADLPVPVVTAVNGSLGGGGIGLALCGDIVLAADTAKLRGGYTGIGLTPDVGSSLLLVQRVGLPRAKRILFLNEPLDAATCEAWGLFDEVHPEAQLSDRAEVLVEQLRRSATGAIGRTKRLLHQAWRASMDEQLAAERRGMMASGGGAEAREGIAAFLEKRAPDFNGAA